MEKRWQRYENISFKYCRVIMKNIKKLSEEKTLPVWISLTLFTFPELCPGLDSDPQENSASR